MEFENYLLVLKLPVLVRFYFTKHIILRDYLAAVNISIISYCLYKMSTDTVV